MPVAKVTNATGITAEPDTEFEDFFLAALRGNREKRDGGREPREYLYASEIGSIIGDSACHRKLWYERNAPDEKESLPPETLLAFEVGDVVGLRITNILAGTGMVQKVELAMDFSPAPLHGRLDVLTMPLLRRVVEVKTSPVEQQPYLPKQEHIDQLILYLHRVRQEEEYAHYSGTLFYVMKNARRGQPVSKSYRVSYDAERAATLLGAAQTAWDATGGSLPVRPAGYNLTRWPCGYCGYKTFCWSGKLGEGKK